MTRAPVPAPRVLSFAGKPHREQRVLQALSRTRRQCLLGVRIQARSELRICRCDRASVQRTSNSPTRAPRQSVNHFGVLNEFAGRRN